METETETAKNEFLQQVHAALVSTGHATRGVTIEHLFSLPISSPTWADVYRELGMSDAYAVNRYCVSRGDRSVRAFVDQSGVLHLVSTRSEVVGEIVKAIRESKIETHIVTTPDGAA